MTICAMMVRESRYTGKRVARYYARQRRVRRFDDIRAQEVDARRGVPSLRRAPRCACRDVMPMMRRLC